MSTRVNLERFIGDDWGIDFSVVDPTTGMPLELVDQAVQLEFEMTRRDLRQVYVTRAGGGIAVKAGGLVDVLVGRDTTAVLDPGHYEWRLRITHPTRGKFVHGHGLLWARR